MVHAFISGVEFIVTKEHAAWYDALYRWVRGDIEEFGAPEYAEEYRQDLCPWEFE